MVKVLGPQQIAWMPRSSWRAAGRSLTNTSGEAATMGPTPGCGQAGQPWASLSTWALSPRRAAAGIWREAPFSALQELGQFYHAGACLESRRAAVLAGDLARAWGGVYPARPYVCADHRLARDREPVPYLRQPSTVGVRLTYGAAWWQL